MFVRPSKGRYPDDRGRHLIVVLERWAFGDESGDQNTPYCAVTGFVASPRQWHLLKGKWHKTLVRYHVPVFHAEEFFQRSNWESASSPYGGWTPEHADAFIDDLLYVVRERVITPVGGLVNVADFNDMHSDMRRVITGGSVVWNWSFTPGSNDDPLVTARFRTTGAPRYPYFAALGLFIDEALSKTPQGTKVHFVLDQQDVYEGYARVAYAERKKRRSPNWEKMGGLRYEDKTDFEELQVADLYAYVMNGWVTRSGEVSPDRFRAAQTFFKKRTGIRIQTTASFEAMLQQIDTEVMDAITAHITGVNSRHG